MSQVNDQGKAVVLNVKGIEIHGVSFGEQHPTKVLALHGWLDNAASFAMLAPLLKNCHVVAVDLPGHGLSGHWPDFNHYHLWAGVEDIELILDELNWSKCNLVGHSMGAAISTLYAGSFSDRLSSLTLIEAIGPMAGTLDDAPKRLKDAIQSMKTHNPDQKKKTDLADFIKTRLNGPLKLSKAGSETLMSRAVLQDEAGFSWRNDKRLKYTSMMRLPEPLIESFIASISCPVLGIFARDGLFNETSIMQRWGKLNCENTLSWFTGGHHLHLEGDVLAIANELNDFIVANN